MPRIVKVGSHALSWREALKDLRGDDLLLLTPGYYEVPNDLSLADVTIKGTGTAPEETVLLGSLKLSAESRYVNLDNLTLNTVKAEPNLQLPATADSYLSLRSTIIRGPHDQQGAVVIDGKSTVELYSVKLFGKLVVNDTADFRLEMNDTQVFNQKAGLLPSIGIHGQGTAIINNSQIAGRFFAFPDCDIELDINNSQLEQLTTAGRVWENLLHTRITSKASDAFFTSGETYANVVSCQIAGTAALGQESRSIWQNTETQELIADQQAKITMTGCSVYAHAEFQGKSEADLLRTSFSSDGQADYYLAVLDHSHVKGSNLILHSNNDLLTVRDEAVLRTSIMASDRDELEVECTKALNVNIFGIKWTAKKR